MQRRREYGWINSVLLFSVSLAPPTGGGNAKLKHNPYGIVYLFHMNL